MDHEHVQQEARQENNSGSAQEVAGQSGNTPTSSYQLPSAPDPSQDPGIDPHDATITPPSEAEHAADAPTPATIPKLKADVAMRMLCSNVETLMKLASQAEEAVTRHFPGDGSPLAIRSPELAPIGHGNDASIPGMCMPGGQVLSPQAAIGSPVETPTASHFHREQASQAPFAPTPIPHEPTPPQQQALARKFFSKKPPPISVSDYVQRIHKYCPMSVGVFLAASNYIYRVTLSEGIVTLSPRSVHRLILTALRVATKALEDGVHSHKHFARVSGISVLELKRLEVALCFLLNWEVQVRLGSMKDEARRAGWKITGSPSGREVFIFGPAAGAIGAAQTAPDTSTTTAHDVLVDVDTKQRELMVPRTEKRKASMVLEKGPAAGDVSA